METNMHQNIKSISNLGIEHLTVENVSIGIFNHHHDLISNLNMNKVIGNFSHYSTTIPTNLYKHTLQIYKRKQTTTSIRTINIIVDINNIQQSTLYNGPK